MVKRILILAVVLASGVAVGSADDVWIGKLPYRDVRVVSVKGGFISFTLRGRTLSKPLRDVTKVQLSSKAEFNKAEGLLSSGKHEQAVAAFEAALAKAGEPWLKSLIRHRQALALKRKAQAAVAEKTPTTRPAKGPPKSPSSAPSPRTRPAATSRPATQPAGEFPTPEAMFKTAPKKPPGLKGMTTLQEDIAIKQHTSRWERWRKALYGKQVKWTLEVADVAKHRSGREVILEAVSPSSIVVSARFPAKSAPALARLSRDEIVVLVGKIAQIDRRETLVELNGISVKPVPRTGPKALKFLGLGGHAHHMVLVIDCSGSMIDRFDSVRHEIAKTISRCSPPQTFHLLFFARGVAGESPPRRLVYATEENKKKAFKFIQGISCRGGPTDPLAALRRAFQVLAKPPSRKKGKVLFLLTDGEFHNNKEVRQAILRWNKGKHVRVNTILYGFRGGEIGTTLRQIAEENGGKFKFVPRAR